VGNKKWISRPTRAVALIAVGAAGAGAAVALASVPDSGGVIHACVTTGQNGTPVTTGANVRIIDPSAGQSCTSAAGAPATEESVTWNSVGPQGPSGPAGPQGPSGPAGADGHTITINGETFTISGLKAIGTVESAPPVLQANPKGPTIGVLTLGSGPRSTVFKVLGWSVGVTGGAGSSGSGRHAGGELQVTKVIDKSSPVLLKACVSGKHFQAATLTLRKSGTTYLMVKLTDALISSYSETSTSSKPTETLSLSYSKIQYQYTQQK
jgi:type VI secretion system secreted protein Hcp